MEHKESFFYKSLSAGWWKVAAVIIIIYVFVLGLFIPLGPSVLSVSSDSVVANTPQELTIQLANAHVTNADETKVLLKGGDKVFYAADQIEVTSNGQLSARFVVDDYVPADVNDALDLIVNTNTDGTFALMDAVRTMPFDSSKYSYSTANILTDVSVANDRPQDLTYPNREILYESIRNLFFHVPMWFAMVVVLFFGCVCSVLYLLRGKSYYDTMADDAVKVAMVLGALGLLTGMLWAKFTWGSAWPNDPKLNSVAIAMLIYVAYMILRKSMTDEIRTARVAAVYNLFAFVLFNVLIFVLPRLTASLHPGNGGNPTVGQYDLDNTMRMVFYPAVIGWTLIAFWVLSLKIRFTFGHLILDDAENK